MPTALRGHASRHHGSLPAAQGDGWTHSHAKPWAWHTHPRCRGRRWCVPRKRTSRPGPYLLHVELLRDRITDPDRYPFNLPALRALTKLALHPRVTYIIGENGSGKSTLLEAIAVGCGMNAEGGSSN